MMLTPVRLKVSSNIRLSRPDSPPSPSLRFLRKNCCLKTQFCSFIHWLTPTPDSSGVMPDHTGSVFVRESFQSKGTLVPTLGSRTHHFNLGFGKGGAGMSDFHDGDSPSNCPVNLIITWGPGWVDLRRLRSA